jgi:ribose transport system substrate-binding protein
MKMMKGLLGMLLVLSLLAAPVLAAEKPVVGLVMKSLANEFFKTMEEGAENLLLKTGRLN